LAKIEVSCRSAKAKECVHVSSLWRKFIFYGEHPLVNITMTLNLNSHVDKFNSLLRGEKMF
jgi:hypothetical protein